MIAPHAQWATLMAAVAIGVGPPLAWSAPAVVMETVTVGNAGNTGEQSRIQNADPTFYGGVAYPFAIGTYEVTAGQYTAFLNAVAASDAYALYHVRMDYDADTTRHGCNIKRHGAPGSYTYSVAPEWANRPVNYVSWADAVRFANWLHNGQPTGPQDTTTTEDGSYRILGIHESSDHLLEHVVREPDATWVIPTENEWYKAAYHKNDGVTGNYWNYPTRADHGVSNTLIDPDPGNHATFSVNFVHTIGPPYFRTEVGAHENSASPYGTFDQGGNVMEFTETVPSSDIRRIRGGSWQWAGTNMLVSEVDDVMHSSDQFRDLGFRVANPALAPVSVPPVGAEVRLRVRINGPVRDVARFLIELPDAAHVRIDVFDVAGRRVPGTIEEGLPAGSSEVRWRADGLAPGLYLARVRAAGQSEVARFVRVR
jgi:formylglycine-generating enzyme required for sulfatase activity